jgi:formylglycine-generating enzyme required for sulfatase activity
MTVQIACPRCDLIVERGTGESLPTHCPACGTRVTCPRCGSTLHSAGQERTLLTHCPRCQAALSGDATAPFEPAAFAEAPPPIVPGFEVGRELGRGGMSIVYQARQLSLGRDVALKVLPPISAREPHLLERFKNEARVGAALVDAHILPIHDVAEVQGVPVLVMPLVEGSDLGRSIKARRAIKKAGASIPADGRPDDSKYPDTVLPVLDQIIAGVAALHQAEVLHRDIKPGNVLVDGRGNAWLSDLGLARLVEEGLGTQPGATLGTFGYASPEQARGEAADYRSDLFSLGVTLYQALTLELPFGKAGARRARRPATPPSKLQPLLSPDFDDVIGKAIALDPRDRYASVAELQEDWKLIRQGQPPKHALRVGLAGRLWRAIRRRPGRTAAAASIVALIIAVGIMGAALLGGNTAPLAKRTVRLTTMPAGARVVLVPLSSSDGAPIEGQAIRPAGTTPLVIDETPVGDYLVVADVPGHGFHEVYRTVPVPKETAAIAVGKDRILWEEAKDGTVELADITIPKGTDITRGMVRFRGGTFTMGVQPGDPRTRHPEAIPAHESTVAPFFLDPTELTVGVYRKVFPDDTARLTNSVLSDEHAVRLVTYYQAMVCAELLGKRLPDEVEYEFAATNGGTTRFPWGDDAGKITKWPFGPVKTPEYDRTQSDPPVFGLYSNVLEWTSSWYTLYPGSDPNSVVGFQSPRVAAAFWKKRVVRGGPEAVLQGEPDPAGRDSDQDWHPRYRLSADPNGRYRGVGFRCARSIKPRFLD